MATSTPATGFPDATNTGLPAGVTLTPSGDLVITQAGTVISGLDITGTVDIEAANVTLIDCKITSPSFAVVNIGSGVTGAVVQNCEINGTGSNNDGSIGIYGSGTFNGNNIYNVENGIALTQGSTSTLIENNYIHDLLASGSPHYDAIQIDGGVSNVTISHNTIINPNNETSAIMIDNYFGAISNIHVDNNILSGGDYTVYDDSQFNGGSITGVSFTNNHMGTGIYGYTAFDAVGPTYTGNVNDAATLIATLNTAANDSTSSTTPVVTVALNNDTGSSATDKITFDQTLKGHADAGAVVTFVSGATKLGSTTADASGNWTFKPTLANGSYTITASETNSAGKVGTANIGFQLDTKPYELTMALVVDNGVSSTDGITSIDALWGHANWYTPVTLRENGKVIATVTSDANGIWSYKPTLGTGAHTIVATEYDVAGNAATASLTFTYNNVPPVLNIGLNNDTGVSKTDKNTSDPTLIGTASPGATLKFAEGSTALGSTTANSNGNWVYDPTGLGQGAQTITATETDLAGNVTTVNFGFTLQTSVPNISETLQNDTGGVVGGVKLTTNPSLTGWTKPNASVTLTEQGSTLGVATANSSGAWSYAPVSMAAGVQTIVATAADLAGNTASTSLTFTLTQPFAA